MRRFRTLNVEVYRIYYQMQKRSINSFRTLNVEVYPLSPIIRFTGLSGFRTLNVEVYLVWLKQKN